MRRLGILVIALSLHSGLPGLCAQPPKAAPREAASSPAAQGGSQPSSGAQAPPFTIRPEDVLDISVWKEPDVSRSSSRAAAMEKFRFPF